MKVGFVAQLLCINVFFHLYKTPNVYCHKEKVNISCVYIHFVNK